METLTVVDARPATIDVRELWASRDLLYFLVWRDIRVRYKQTLVGVAWTVLQPLLTMLVLSAVFARSAFPWQDAPYPLFAYAGLVAWTFFANALFSSSNSLVGSGPLITKVYFPRVLIPIAAVGARLLDFAVTFLLLVALMAYYHAAVTWRVLLLPPLVILTTLAALAGGMWLSALSVKYRDVNVALPHAMQLLMFMSPVFYPLAMLPPSVRRFAELNPIAVLLHAYRVALFGGSFDWTALALQSVVVLCALTYATISFTAMEQEFADVV
jgi:lipopolysaccharide transport system permease protein